MRKVNISPVDTVFANGIYPIEMLFFYSQKLSTQRIRSSIEFLSKIFWPLFGVYDSGAIQFDRYSEEACFQEVISAEEFDQNESYSELYRKYQNMNPSEMSRLFHMTVVQYNNGTALIPKMNHLAGDGYSYFYFLSSLAALTRGLSIPFKKYVIRSLVKPAHNRNVLKNFILDDIVLRPAAKPPMYTTKIETIPKNNVRETIQTIKSSSDQRVSTNDVLSAIFVKKLDEIQKSDTENQMRLNIPVDVRRHVKEYGQKYFGNALLFNVTDFYRSEIRESNVEDIAVKIRESMPRDTRKRYMEFLNGLEDVVSQKQVDRLRPFDPETGCLITNLSKMPTHRLNFGTGDPGSIVPLTMEKNAAAIFSEGDNFILRYAW
ncbi:acyltransferase [Acidobacteriota bacterium]